MFKEFKEFITRGNVMDLAVGVVIGGAFQKIITSLVEDIIMPCISAITGKVDFSDMAITIGEANIKYGNFLTAIVDFLLIALVIFLVIREINRINTRVEKINGKLVSEIEKKTGKKAEEVVPEEPTTKVCPYCLSEIPYKATKCSHCTSDLEK